MQADREIKLNTSDITLKDKREKSCKMINFKTPANKNVSVAEFEKQSKYKDLETEVEKVWHIEHVTILIMIGILCTIRNGTEEFREQIPESSNLAEMRK